MRHSRHPSIEAKEFNWHVVKLLWPFLLEYKVRVTLALACLILTKVASVYLPFVLKNIVDCTFLYSLN